MCVYLLRFPLKKDHANVNGDNSIPFFLIWMPLFIVFSCLITLMELLVYYRIKVVGADILAFLLILAGG